MHFLDPTFLVSALGVFGVIALIFAESGVLVGIIFPGDSLLFVAGLFASHGYFNIYVLVIGAIIAAIAGDTAGYWLGRTLGSRIYDRKDTWYFKQSYLKQTKDFYAHHGKKTLILARFIPVVRTLAPILAGVSEMEYKIFFSYNIVGGVVWPLLMCGIGYALGNVIPESGHYVTIIVLAIVVLSFLPPIYTYFKNRSSASSQ
jgi:membrane-associated protein